MSDLLIRVQTPGIDVGFCWNCHSFPETSHLSAAVRSSHRIVTNAAESLGRRRCSPQTALAGPRSIRLTPTHHYMLPFISCRAQIVIGAVALLSSTSVAVAQRASAPAVRVGVVDSRQLLQEMPGRAQAESEFALDMAKAREMVHTATDSMKAAVDELSRHEADLRPQQREAAMMMLRARELALEDMVAQLNAITGTRLTELQQPLIDLMRSAVKSVRERERLTLVFDLGSEGAPIAFDEAVNITPLVLEELRRRPKPVLPGR